MRQAWIGKSIAICVAVLALSGPRAAEAQQLELTFNAGRVTLDVRDVTVRQVLDEWARRGKVVVVNAELVGDQRLSLQLDNVPERQAIDAVLRSVAGYVIVERGTDTSGPSIFDRIQVVAQSELRAATAAPATEVDPVAITSPPAASLTEPPRPRDPIDSGAVPTGYADRASGQAPALRFSVVNVEPADGRPDAARPAPASAIGRRTAPTQAITPGTSIVEEPPNGRPDETRPILANVIGGSSPPVLPNALGGSTAFALPNAIGAGTKLEQAATPETSGVEEPSKGLVEDVNGRETTK